MNGRLAGQAFRCSLEGFDAVVPHLIKKDIERRFVELNDIDAGCRDLARFRVQNPGERSGEFWTAVVIIIVEGIHHGHGAGQSEFRLPLGLRTQETSVFDIDRFLAFYRPGNNRYLGVVPVANTHGAGLLEIYPGKALNKGGDKMPAGLFAVTHDVDPGHFLVAQYQADSVFLAFLQKCPFQAPGRPEFQRLRQPGGFGQAAGNGCL